VPRKHIPEFPHESPGQPWPTLTVSTQERQYVPVPDSLFARRWRLLRASFDLLLLDIGSASLKGGLFGIFLFAMIFSFVTIHASGFCWLVGWHWQLASGAVLLSLLLIGFDLTLVIILGIALWLSFRMMLTHPILLLGFIGGGIVLRGLLEVLPQSNPFHRRRTQARRKRPRHRIDRQRKSTNSPQV